jgi:hypothetical protein
MKIKIEIKKKIWFLMEEWIWKEQSIKRNDPKE